MAKDKNNAAADKKAADNKAKADQKPADDKAKADNTPEVIDNPTVKRQKAAKALREKRAKEVAKTKKAESNKADANKSAAEKASKTKPKKDTRARFEDDKGRKFSFKATAPKTINIDGVSKKTEDIIKDKEVMMELVYGNSNFIEQIH